MKAAITGTPGVGKTTVSEGLRKEGYSVLDLNDFIKKEDLREEKDEYMDSYNVDLDKMIKLYNDKAPDHDIVEGHLSHHLGVEPIIILRCAPDELRKRASVKDWPDHKLQENVEAEVMDVILIEALSESDEVYEIDTTEIGPEAVKDKIIDILDGDTDDNVPGDIDWTDQYLTKE